MKIRDLIEELERFDPYDEVKAQVIVEHGYDLVEILRVRRENDGCTSPCVAIVVMP